MERRHRQVSTDQDCRVKASVAVWHTAHDTRDQTCSQEIEPEWRRMSGTCAVYGDAVCQESVSGPSHSRWGGGRSPSRQCIITPRVLTPHYSPASYLTSLSLASRHSTLGPVSCKQRPAVRPYGIMKYARWRLAELPLGKASLICPSLVGRKIECAMVTSNPGQNREGSPWNIQCILRPTAARMKPCLLMFRVRLSWRMHSAA